MADDLLVGVGADVSALARDYAQIVAMTRELQRDITRAMAGVEVIPDLSNEARNAGTQLITGLRQSVQEGGDALRRDVAAALVPATLVGEFARLADTVRTGTATISTTLSREGHEAGRALITGLAAELPAAQQVLSNFARTTSATLSSRLLTDLTPEGTRAGRQLVSGLSAALQSTRGVLRADVVGALIPTNVDADFSRLTTAIRSSAADLANALGSGGEDAARRLITGLASGLTGADRVITQFASSARGTLARADLLGDMQRKGELSGAQLIRGVTASITAGSGAIQDAVTTALVPANLPGQLATITTGVSREIAKITPLLAATGTTAGRALVLSLGAELSQGTAVIVRDFSRGAQTAVAGLDIFGDLTPAGQRAGTQLISGLVQVVNREGTALRGTLATALIPTTLSGELTGLTRTITAGLQQVPPLFLTAGRESGGAFTSSLATQLGESKALITGFARDASASLTAAITVGDTAASGERAGRALAGAIASGVAAESPAIRAALSAALLPAGVAPEVGRVVETIKAEVQTLVPAAATVGRDTGRVIAQGIITGLAPIKPELRALTAGETIGIAIDATPIIKTTQATQDLSAATERASAATKDLAAAGARIDFSKLTEAEEVTLLMAEAEQRRAAQQQQNAQTFVRATEQEAAAAQQAARVKESAANDAQTAAAAEAAARKQVQAAFDQDLAKLVTYRASIDATNADAVAGFERQAAAIREQARAIGIEGDELFKLDRAILRTVDSLRVQGAEARNSARAIASQAQAGLSRGIGGATSAELANITRNANTAKKAIGGVTIAGKDMQQITTRLGPALIGVGFGLEALARGGDAADAGLRTALRAIASFAAFFGPTGFIVAGVAAATAAIIDMFKTASDESKKATKKMGDDLVSLVEAADFIGIQKELQKINEGVLTFNEATGKVARTGGLPSMIAELDKLKASAGSDLQRTLVKVFSFGIGGLEERMVPATKRIEELERLIPLAKAKQKAFSEALLNPPAALKEIKGLPTVNVTAGIKDAEKAIRDLAEQVRVVQDAFLAVNGDAGRQAQILQRAIPLYDAIRQAAQAHAGEVSEAANALHKMLTDLTNIDAISVELSRRKFGGILTQAEGGILVPRAKITDLKDRVQKIAAAETIEIPVDFDTQDFSRSLQKSIQKAASAQDLLDFAKLFGTRQQVADATENVNIATANLTKTFQAAFDATMHASDSAEVHAAKLKVLKAAAAEAGVSIKGLTKDTENLTQTLTDIGGAARGVASLVREIRGVDDELSRAIDSAGRFADALGQAAQIKFGGKGGLFSSFSNLLKGIPVIGEAIASAVQFGRDLANAITGAAEKSANNDILKENNAQLERLRQDLAGFNNSIGQLTGASRVIQESAILNARLGTSGATRGFRDVEPLDRELRAAGSSLAELKRRAESFGITITDAAGRISAQGLADLNEALKLAAKAAANFENDVSSLREIQNARRDIFDITDPAAVFNDAVDQIRQFAPELFKKFLAGIDASTPAARQAAEQSIRALFDFITKQGIDLTPFLQGFDSVEDFLNTVLDADHALDNFADTAKDATNEMVNVVKGFKDFNLERARFAATANVATTSATGGIPFIPRPNPTPIPVGTQVSTTTVGTVSFAPVIRIDGLGKDAVEITTEVVTELRRRARASANPEVRKTVNLLPS